MSAAHQRARTATARLRNRHGVTQVACSTPTCTQGNYLTAQRARHINAIASCLQHASVHARQLRNYAISAAQLRDDKLPAARQRARTATTQQCNDHGATTIARCLQHRSVHSRQVRAHAISTAHLAARQRARTASTQLRDKYKGRPAPHRRTATHRAPRQILYRRETRPLNLEVYSYTELATRAHAQHKYKTKARTHPHTDATHTTQTHNTKHTT